MYTVHDRVHVQGVYLRNSSSSPKENYAFFLRQKTCALILINRRETNNITIPRGLNSVIVGHASVMLAYNKTLLHLYEANISLRRTARASPEGARPRERVHCSLVQFIARPSRAHYRLRVPSARGSLASPPPPPFFILFKEKLFLNLVVVFELISRMDISTTNW